jgi:uncharacterized protein
MIDFRRLKTQIDGICRELPVRRLGVFGSALTRDFRPGSDVDVLVVFDEDSKADLFDKYFELKERLEKVFGREVDLVVDRPFKNPVFKESVEKTRTIIYEG